MHARPDHNAAPKRPARRRGLVLSLLAIPFIGTLWVTSYASLTPMLWGIPFFYWYQLLWIVIGAALTIIAYVADPE